MAEFLRCVFLRSVQCCTARGELYKGTPIFCWNSNISQCANSLIPSHNTHLKISCQTSRPKCSIKICSIADWSDTHSECTRFRQKSGGGYKPHSILPYHKIVQFPYIFIDYNARSIAHYLSNPCVSEVFDVC